MVVSLHRDTHGTRLFEWGVDRGDAAAPCRTGADCSTGVCDLTARSCVECVRNIDCSDDASCKEKVCVPRTARQNTLDCPEGDVCGRSEGYCAQCFRDDDCADGGCVNEECRPHCMSDKGLRKVEQLCDLSGTCASTASSTVTVERATTAARACASPTPASQGGLVQRGSSLRGEVRGERIDRGGPILRQLLDL